MCDEIVTIVSKPPTNLFSGNQLHDLGSILLTEATTDETETETEQEELVNK